MPALILLEIEYSYGGGTPRDIRRWKAPAIKWRTLLFRPAHVKFNSLFTSSIKRTIKDAKGKRVGLAAEDRTPRVARLRPQLKIK